MSAGQSATEIKSGNVQRKVTIRPVAVKTTESDGSKMGVRYRKKVAVRDPQIEVSLALGTTHGKKRYQLRVSNLTQEWIDEIDYEHNSWITVFDGDVLRIRQTKDGEAVIILDKSTDKFISIKDPIKARRLHSDLYKIYKSWNP